MKIKINEIKENNRDLWDKAAGRFPHSHPLNAYGWGKVREVDRWKNIYIVAKEGESVKGMATILIRKIPWTGLSVMYVPRGPIWYQEDQITLKALLNRLKKEGKKNHAIFLRIEPNIAEKRNYSKDDPFVAEGFIHLDHRWTLWNSPRDVYHIDLTKADNEEDLFKTLERDARRCVRKAKKEGLIVRSAVSLEELRKFYDIFSEFSVEKGFGSRNFDYQKTLWNEYISKDKGKLFLAVYKGEIIGGLICVAFGKTCVAMHMGTPYQYQKLQSYYAYIWESIRWAKNCGYEIYSFRGVGTTPTQERFKRKFGPQAVALVGYYDFPFHPLLYRLLYFFEFWLLPKLIGQLISIWKIYKKL